MYKYNSMYPYFIIVCVTNDIQIETFLYLYEKLSYTCTYYFVSTPNPLAVKSLTNFLLFFENFLFCLPPPEID